MYIQELEKKTQFVNGHRKVRTFLKLKSILNILVPSLVRDKIRLGKKNFSEDEGEVTIIFIDIHEFDSLVNSYTGTELLQFLDQIYNTFDQLCDQFGLQKIETVGKTYMACGGLKYAEKKIDARLLNRHHSVRVADFAMDVANHVKQIQLKNGRHSEVKIGIHTGKVISGVVGETKPQFSLIGDTVNKTSRVCAASEPLKVSVSKETHHYLYLYTNNYQFQQTFVEMKGIGKEPIFSVSNLKGRTRNQQDKNVLKTFDGQLNNNEHGGAGGGPSRAHLDGNNVNGGQTDKPKKDNVAASKNNHIGIVNESDSVASGSGGNSNRGYDSHRGLLDRENYQPFDQDD